MTEFAKAVSWRSLWHLGLVMGMVLAASGHAMAEGSSAQGDPAKTETPKQPDGTQADVDVTIKVQLAAQLKVVEAAGSGTISTGGTGFVGDPSPSGPTANMGRVRLFTDHCVGGVAFEFPRIAGIRSSPGAWYGVATGRNKGYSLGVQPFVRHAWGVQSYGSLSAMNGAASNGPLFVPGPGSGFCNGAHDFFIGLATRWDLTLPGQPRFAAPDTYRIPVTAVIVP